MGSVSRNYHLINMAEHISGADFSWNQIIMILILQIEENGASLKISIRDPFFFSFFLLLFENRPIMPLVYMQLSNPGRYSAISEFSHKTRLELISHKIEARTGLKSLDTRLNFSSSLFGQTQRRILPISLSTSIHY